MTCANERQEDSIAQPISAKASWEAVTGLGPFHYCLWGPRGRRSPEIAAGGTHCRKSFFIMPCSVRCSAGSCSSEAGDRSQR